MEISYIKGHSINLQKRLLSIMSICTCRIRVLYGEKKSYYSLLWDRNGLILGPSNGVTIILDLAGL